MQVGSFLKFSLSFYPEHFIWAIGAPSCKSTLILWSKDALSPISIKTETLDTFKILHQKLNSHFICKILHHVFLCSVNVCSYNLNGSFLQDLVFASYHPPFILVLHSELLLAWFEYQFLWSISDSYILISSNLCLFYIALKSNSDRLEQSLNFESYSVRSRWVNPCRVYSLCNHLRAGFTTWLSVHSSFVCFGILALRGSASIWSILKLLVCFVQVYRYCSP